VGLPAVFVCLVGWLALFLYGWLVRFFCCVVSWFGSFVVWLAGLVLLLYG